MLLPYNVSIPTKEVKHLARYIAFDVETPNNDNNSMSSIGISVVENGVIVDEFYSLINPEARFDGFNIAFTGITPEAVADAPTFGELWTVIGPIMSSGTLVAHNAPFDMSVLAKSLKRYNINWKDKTEYGCTCMMSKKALPELYNHKLDTISDYLGIQLLHHNSGSDAKACALILIECINRGIDPGAFIRPYDITQAHTIKPESKRRFFKRSVK